MRGKYFCCIIEVFNRLVQQNKSQNCPKLFKFEYVHDLMLTQSMRFIILNDFSNSEITAKLFHILSFVRKSAQVVLTNYFE